MAKRFYEGYAGMDERRRQEKEDSMMIKEDKGAIANLPKEVVYKQYPREGSVMPEDLRDGLGSVDEQMNVDKAGVRKNFNPKKV